MTEKIRRPIPPASARRSPSRAARRYARPARRCRRPICIMQPMLPAAITCGAGSSSVGHLARRAAPPRSPAAAGCRCRPSRSRDGCRGGSTTSKPAAVEQRLRLGARSAGRAAASRRRDRRRRQAGGAATGGPSPSSAISSVTSRASAATARRRRRRSGSSREHVAVVLHRRAAARGVDDDGVEPRPVAPRASRRGCSAPPPRGSRAALPM